MTTLAAAQKTENKAFLQGDLVDWRNEYGVLSGNFRGEVVGGDTAIITVNGYQMEAPIKELFHTEAKA